MSAAAAAKPGYRADIDGLRAVAVLAVVWFHSGLPGLPGGFVGVDVFFVISGYLIGGIVLRELAANGFRFARFYERRFRRIAPALVIVLLATLIAGYLLLLPAQLITLGRSALSALAMVPNLFFWRQGSGGYFGLTKRVSPPLLHTWSLGVEEQFYLLFPLFLLLAVRFRVTRPALSLAIAASFALCVAAGMTAPPAAFYLLPMRAWELGLGALLAGGGIAIPPRLRAPSSIAGLALLAIGFAVLHGTSPYIAELLAIPTLGTAMLIGSGAAAPANRLLALRGPVWIGRISYSLYLWHWPVFVYLRQWRGGGQLSADWAAGGIALSFALAWLTYRLIEQPARRAAVPFRRVVTACGAGAALILLAAAAVIASRGFPSRFSSAVLARAAQSTDYSPHARSCTGKPLADLERDCWFGQGSRSVAIWGDSHAAAEVQGIAAGLSSQAVLISEGGCPPTLASPGIPILCDRHNRDTIAWLAARPQITTVLLAAYWGSYGKGDAGPAMWRGVQAAVSGLPGKRVIIVAGVPQPGADVPFTSAMRAYRGLPPMHWPCPPAQVPVSGATVVDLSAAFCAHPQPWKLFTDGNHASMTANREVIAPAVRRALSAPL